MPRPTSSVEPTLLEVTLDLLKNRNRQLTLEKIANDTGLTFSWLAMISSNDQAGDPSVNRIQILYEYLSGKKLQY